MALPAQYKSQWQDFCYDLIDAKKQDMLETPYQELIENSLRQLGWSKVKGEICPKERINVGSNNQLEPDITIKIDDKPVFVIEVKRPRNSITKRQEEQLLSYMRIRQKKLGLYIGDEIRLYFDIGDSLPIMVWQTDISMDAKNGAQFVDFFNRQTFNSNRIINFCEDKFQELNSKVIMAAFQQALIENQDNTIRQALTEYFVDYKKCNRAIVDTILGAIHFSTSEPHHHEASVEEVPNTTSNGIVLTTGTSAGKKDTTKYSLDGGKSFYGKGKFVREVVSHFLSQNPNLTYNQLKQIFPDEYQGSYGVIRSKAELESSKQEKKDLNSRYEVARPLTTKDGTEFVVCNQWGKYNIGNILRLIDKWGWSTLNS